MLVRIEAGTRDVTCAFSDTGGVLEASRTADIEQFHCPFDHAIYKITHTVPCQHTKD